MSSAADLHATTIIIRQKPDCRVGITATDRLSTGNATPPPVLSLPALVYIPLSFQPEAGPTHMHPCIAGNLRHSQRNAGSSRPNHPQIAVGCFMPVHS